MKGFHRVATTRVLSRLNYADMLVSAKKLNFQMHVGRVVSPLIIRKRNENGEASLRLPSYVRLPT